MQTYCLSFGDYTDNIGSKKVTMTNKVIREKSRRANCISNISRFLKQKPNKNTIKKVVGIVLILNFSYTNHYETSC